MEPITRSEMLMDGQYVEPKTRKEKILAGEDLEPVTREEYFLKEYRHSGGDVDVVQLTATENKTYTAPEGKAYNPVNVNVPEKKLTTLNANENKTYSPPSGYDGFSEVEVYVPYVTQGTTINENGTYTPPAGVDGFGRVIVDVPTPPPSLQSLTASHNGYFLPSSGYVGFSEVNVDVALPQNAYLLESQKDDVVTIQHGAEFDMPKLIASIEPQQDLHGYDAPWVGGAGKNKCPINSGTITVGDFVTFSTPLPSGTYSFSLKASRTPSSGSYASIIVYDIDGNAYSPVIGMASTDLDGVKTIKAQNISYNNGISKLYIYSIAGQWSESRNYTLTISDLQIELGSTATSFAPYSNICPISGWDEANVNVTGVNVWDEEWEVGTYNLQNGEKEAYANYFRSKNFIPIHTNTEYRVVTSNQQIYILFYDMNHNYISYRGGGTFTTPINAYYMNFVITTTNSYNPNENPISINYPSTDTSYHAYNGHTYTIDLNGTRYGGRLDVVSGVLTVDRVSLTVDENSNIISGSGGLPFRIDLLTEAKASSSASALTGVKCNFLKEVTQSSSWGVDGTFSRVTTDAKIVYFKVNSEITTVQQLKTFLQSNNLQFVYELATPTTIQLTPTQVKSLLGVNNIFADTGEVDVQIWTKEV